MFGVQGDAAKGHKAMSLSKPTSAFTAGLVIVLFAACLGASAAAADGQHSKRAAQPGHRIHHLYAGYRWPQFVQQRRRLSLEECNEIPQRAPEYDKLCTW
jgi:hypothetical protein